jgi:TolB-like protein
LAQCFLKCSRARRAFREGSKIETLHAILTRDPVAAETRREISEPVKRIVSRCLNKDPDQRFQSAQDLAFHLEELSVPSPPTQAVAGPQTAKPKPVARIVSAGWFPLVALLVVVVAVAFAAYLLLSRTTTLAVLPFVNDDPEQEHFVDGITGALIGNLSRYEKLRIVDLATRNVARRDEAVIDRLKGDQSAKFALRAKIQRWGNRVQIEAALSDTRPTRLSGPRRSPRTPTIWHWCRR